MTRGEVDILEQKAAVRRQIKEVLARLSGSEKAAQSAKACQELQKQSIWDRARSILFYAPLGDELDLWALLQVAITQGKRVALPRYSQALDRYAACEVKDPEVHIRMGRFGIREPIEGCEEIELKRLDLVLVPGVAFDLHGHRLGRGKGYYDRLLRAAGGKTCGAAFDEQVLSAVPVEAHDVVLNCILTPARWFEL